jgi:hypothetical protein
LNILEYLNIRIDRKGQTQGHEIFKAAIRSAVPPSTYRRGQLGEPMSAEPAAKPKWRLEKSKNYKLKQSICLALPLKV